MTIYNITVDVYVGGTRAAKVNSWNPSLSTSDVDINKYGSVWGERQVLRLGTHFNIYKNYPQPAWSLSSSISSASSSVIPTSLRQATDKLPAGSVSGNFGEVLTIMALEWKIAPRALRICHLCPSSNCPNIKCPDLLVESYPLKQDYKIFKNPPSTSLPRPPNLPIPPRNLPTYIPGECKNSDFLGGLRQLAKYWMEIGSKSPIFGFGFISRIDYRSCSLKINLMVPLNSNGLGTMLAQPGLDENDLIQSDFKGLLYGF